MKHRRIVVQKRGGPEVLQVVEEDAPGAGVGEVRVRVQAAGVSGYDLMMRRPGWMPGMPRVPFTPGLDVVGVVDEIGPEVHGVVLGQAIACGTFHLGYGGYAETLCIPASAAVPLPQGLDPAEAVCLVVDYLTALVALRRTVRMQSGQRILVHGAAGGVGTALLELGRLIGLEMYGTASRRNHELVTSLGATPINYRTEDFVERIRALTGDGVDAVFDPIGGATQLLRSYRTLRDGGSLVWFGVAATAKSGMRVIPLSLLMRFVLSVLPDGKQAPMMQDASKFPEVLPKLLELLAAGKIKPVVTDRVPLSEAARAHEILERGGHAGKVVLVPDS